MATADCQPLEVARALGHANIPFRAVCEDDLRPFLAGDAPPVLLVESPDVLTEGERATVETYKAGGGRVVWSGREGWLAEVRAAVRLPAVTVLAGAPTVRTVAREKAGKTIVHVINLDVRRSSSFEDRVNPVADLRLRVRLTKAPASVKALSADAEAAQGAVRFATSRDDRGDIVELTLPRVQVSTIVVIE
jgi:hypothetical protein